MSTLDPRLLPLSNALARLLADEWLRELADLAQNPPTEPATHPPSRETTATESVAHSREA